jgi:hypothetical protein
LKKKTRKEKDNAEAQMTLRLVERAGLGQWASSKIRKREEKSGRAARGKGLVDGWEFP